MTADIRLDDPRSEWVTVQGSALNVAGSDVILDSPARRTAHGGEFRRALVHDERDGLTVNFGGDYPGGVLVNDATLSLRVSQQGVQPALPADGLAGDLLVTRNSTNIGGHVADEGTVTLWLCIGPERRGGASQWVPVKPAPQLPGPPEMTRRRPGRHRAAHTA